VVVGRVLPGTHGRSSRSPAVAVVSGADRAPGFDGPGRRRLPVALMSCQERATARHPAATAVAVLAVIGALGSASMTAGHVGVETELLDPFGPGELVLPVAVAFVVGTLLYLTVAYAALRVRRWGWPTALAVNAVALIAGGIPFRGWVSAAAVAVSAASIAILVSATGRAAFGRR